jgi:restriction system protein
MSKGNKELEKEIKTKLLQHIRCGTPGLKTGGLALEQLVRELLIIDGFTAEVLGTRAFPDAEGADIRASRTDVLRADDFLIHVTHGGPARLWGAQQFLELRKSQPEEYRNHQLVLVTTSDVRDADKDAARDRGIILLGGSDLAQRVFSSMAKLHPDTKRQLGLSEVSGLMR